MREREADQRSESIYRYRVRSQKSNESSQPKKRTFRRQARSLKVIRPARCLPRDILAYTVPTMAAFAKTPSKVWATMTQHALQHPFVHRWTGSRLRPKYDWETLWSQQEIESGDSSTVELDPDYDEDPLQTSWLALEEAVAKPPPR